MPPNKWTIAPTFLTIQEGIIVTTWIRFLVFLFGEQLLAFGIHIFDLSMALDTNMQSFLAKGEMSQELARELFERGGFIVS